MLCNIYLISVSKCIGHSCLYVWDLKQHMPKRNKPTTAAVPVQPLALLEYAEVTIDYIFLSAVKGKTSEVSAVKAMEVSFLLLLLCVW